MVTLSAMSPVTLSARKVVTTLYLKKGRYSEVEPLLQPILRDAAGWPGLMQATVSKVSNEELSTLPEKSNPWESNHALHTTRKAPPWPS